MPHVQNGLKHLWRDRHDGETGLTEKKEIAEAGIGLELIQGDGGWEGPIHG